MIGVSIMSMRFWGHESLVGSNEVAIRETLVGHDALVDVM
jgi:hypothetical protein